MADQEMIAFCMTPNPYHDDGRLDEDALRVQLRRLVAARTGLFLCSGGGQAKLMS